jgi:hypothetical protein
MHAHRSLVRPQGDGRGEGRWERLPVQVAERADTWGSGSPQPVPSGLLCCRRRHGVQLSVPMSPRSGHTATVLAGVDQGQVRRRGPWP